MGSLDTRMGSRLYIIHNRRIRLDIRTVLSLTRAPHPVHIQPVDVPLLAKLLPPTSFVTLNSCRNLANL